MKLKGAKKITSAIQKTNKPLTNQQKLDKLRVKNPLLQSLISKFDLDDNLEF